MKGEPRKLKVIVGGVVGGEVGGEVIYFELFLPQGGAPPNFVYHLFTRFLFAILCFQFFSFF